MAPKLATCGGSAFSLRIQGLVICNWPWDCTTARPPADIFVHVVRSTLSILHLNTVTRNTVPRILQQPYAVRLR
ncbi:hypothetical protein Micbo1qcDRAFT_156172, partial [Microdochium bolleyi]